MDARTTQSIKDQIDYEFAREAPPEGFPAFGDIAGARYIDPAFEALEASRLWPKVWLYAAHMDQIPEPGCWLAVEEASAPVIIVHGRDGMVRAFYNTCRHRGAPVVRGDAGRDAVLTCKYHSWSYGLDGRLLNVPDERDFVGLDKSCRGLKQLRCERWANWIFINEDPDAAPLMDFLDRVPDEIGDFQPDDLRFVSKHSIRLESNWKVAIDAFLEVYHLKTIHPKTVAQLLDHAGAAMGLFRGGHSRMATPNQSRITYDDGGEGMPEIETVGEIPRISNLAYSLFPNCVFPLDPSGFPFLMFWPEDIRTTRMDVHWFAPTKAVEQVSEAQWNDRRALFDGILDEDTQNLKHIQKSVESPAFEGMPLNYQERRIYHLHEEIDRIIGPENIPGSLRVRQVLQPYHESY